MQKDRFYIENVHLPSKKRFYSELFQNLVQCPACNYAVIMPDRYKHTLDKQLHIYRIDIAGKGVRL